MNIKDAKPERILLDRSVRVFVSSTFLDLMEERNYLARNIFPQLSALCRSRQVEFTEVDLRWGITEKQSNEGQTLPICLDEINKCHPFFIGILAERYGWVPGPEQINDRLLESYPWIKAQLEKGKSVTELEIVHGVLNNPEMKDKALFYFRASTYHNRHYSKKKEIDKSDNTDSIKLQALKNRIRSGPYRLLDGYSSLKELGERILDDLWDRIDSLFPALDTLDDLDRESQEHEAFASHISRAYVERLGYFEQLDRHASSDSLPLVITGPSGIGKTALLAAWALKYRQENPGVLFIIHFFGVTPESTKLDVFLRRVIQEIRNRWAPEIPLPDSPGELRNQFSFFLKQVPHNECMILVLDGLNQLTGQNLDLHWLPENFPKNVRVITSTIEGQIIDGFRKRQWPVLEIKQLVPEERTVISRRYLSLYSKTPEPWFENKLREAPQTANPLYLRILLDEMRLLGTHKSLMDDFGQYLQANTIPDLYNLVLNRIELDFKTRYHPELVRNALCLLWAAPRGLSEIELRQLLGTIDHPLPGLYWSPIYNALQESLVNRNGLLGFFHDYLRQSIHERYMKNPHDEFDIHMRLAEYFETMFSKSSRGREEYRALSLQVPETALELAEKNGFADLAARACFTIAGAEISAAVGVSPESEKHFSRASRMALKACDIARENNLTDVLADSLCLRSCTEARSNPDRGKLDLIDEAIALRRKQEDMEGVRNGYDERATQALRYEQYDEVEWAIDEAVRINDSLDKPDIIWRIQVEQLRGEFYAACGRWQDAADKLQWTLTQFRRRHMISNACAALGWLGLSLCHLQNKYKTGMKMIHQALNTENSVLGSTEGVAKWLQGVGELFLEERKIHQALEAFGLCFELREEENHAQLDRTRESITHARKMSGKNYAQWRKTFDPRKNEFSKYAFLWGLRPFRKFSGNPILTSRGATWESGRVFNPAAIVHENKIALLYRAQPQGENQPSCIGLAFSEDGFNFQRLQQPVLAPQKDFEQGGGCEDPRIVKIEDKYILTYTAYDGVIARLALAVSKDLISWENRRLAFTDEQWDEYFPRRDFPGTPRGWSKSGAILAQKIDGYYWMYFGDTCIWAACSESLDDKWEIIPRPVLKPRRKLFDSMLVEPGPPPVLLSKEEQLRLPAGIWLGYNGAKERPGDEPHYCFGHVLLDPENPTRVLRTSVRPLLRPRMPYETSSPEKRIIFGSGLVQFKNKWILYYGMDDENIGAAICEF